MIRAARFVEDWQTRASGRLAPQLGESLARVRERVGVCFRSNRIRLSVRFGVLFNFFFLLDRARRVFIVLSSENQFFRQALRYGLDGSQGFLACDQADLEKSEVDSSEGRHVDCLSLGVASLSDSGGVFSRAHVSDGVHDGLQRVLAGGLVDDFQGVLDDPDGLRFLTGVSALEHEAADQSLDDRAEGLSESPGLVPAGRVRNEDLALRVLDGNIIFKSGVRESDSFIGPSSKERWNCGEGSVLKLYVTRSLRLISSVAIRRIKSFYNPYAAHY